WPFSTRSLKSTWISAIWPETCVPTSTVSVAWSVPVLETTDSMSPRVISTNRYPPAASRPVPSNTRARSSTATAPAEPHRIFFFIVVLPTVGFARWRRQQRGAGVAGGVPGEIRGFARVYAMRSRRRDCRNRRSLRNLQCEAGTLAPALARWWGRGEGEGEGQGAGYFCCGAAPP